MTDSAGLPSNLTVVNPPLIRVKLAALRAEATPFAEFRALLSDIAALMVSAVTAGLETVPVTVRTPLADCPGERLARPFTLVPILRAGLGMLDGFLKMIPDAAVGHIGMFRNEETLQPESYYLKMPPGLAGTEVVLLDPMLATGRSAASAVAKLRGEGATRIRLACVVSCPEGIREFSAAHPDVPIFTAAVDSGLNDRGYIVPGLGDAGDRYYGTTGVIE